MYLLTMALLTCGNFEIGAQQILLPDARPRTILLAWSSQLIEVDGVVNIFVWKFGVSMALALYVLEHIDIGAV